MMKKQHNQWASKFGFILATAGAAIGLGNLWKFPYLMGKNGGFSFLIAYLVFICILGIPVMIAEMALGRKTLHNPVQAYGQICPGARIVGVFGVLAAFFILSYYSVVGGWILKYAFSYLTTFKAPENFAAYTAQPVEPVVWHFVFMAMTALVCYFGIRGIEKASKFMMPALFIIVIVIIIRSVTLPGAVDGLAFIFKPDLSNFSIQSVSAALGQVFYSLSLCMGITVTYGSYLSKKENIPKSCITVAGLDTGMAILAGIAIFPAVFSFGLEPAQGPTLIFETLPKVFASLRGGALFALLFFLLIFFAALTSGIALLEVTVSFAIDNLKWERSKAVFVIASLIFLIGIPSSLAFGPLADLEILNYNFYYFIGMVTDNILLPLGGLFMCYYLGWRWQPKLLVKEIQQEGVKFKLSALWLFSIRFITPVLILIVTISGFMSIFNVVTGG